MIGHTLWHILRYYRSKYRKQAFCSCLFVFFCYYFWRTNERDYDWYFPVMFSRLCQSVQLYKLVFISRSVPHSLTCELQRWRNVTSRGCLERQFRFLRLAWCRKILTTVPQFLVNFASNWMSVQFAPLSLLICLITSEKGGTEFSHTTLSCRDWDQGENVCFIIAIFFF